MLFDITKEEQQYILKERKIKEERAAKKRKQESCKHVNKIFKGRYGHNGDSWYYCKDCGLEWDE